MKNKRLINKIEKKYYYYYYSVAVTRRNHTRTHRAPVGDNAARCRRSDGAEVLEVPFDVTKCGGQDVYRIRRT